MQMLDDDEKEMDILEQEEEGILQESTDVIESKVEIRLQL
jgi:hypothetical protein